MKINIELNKESIRDFFNDAYEDDYNYSGTMPLKLDGKIYKDFFKVIVDTVKAEVKITCPDVFSLYIGFRRYEELDFEEKFYEPRMEVELSEQEKMLFLVGCDAYIEGKYKVLDEQKNGVDVIDPRKDKAEKK